jgi:hypothetical protein
MLHPSTRGMSPPPAAAQSSREQAGARKEVARSILERRRGREVAGFWRGDGRGRSPDLEGNKEVGHQTWKGGRGRDQSVGFFFPTKTRTRGGLEPMRRNTKGRDSELGEAARRQIECHAVFSFISIPNSTRHPNADIQGSKFQFLILWFNTNFQTEPEDFLRSIAFED